MILANGAKCDGAPFRLFGTATGCFVSTEVLLAKAGGHARNVLARNLDGDEEHRAIPAVLCNAGGGMLARLFGGMKRPAANDAVWDEIGPGATTATFTGEMTELMEQRAAATYGVLRRLVAEFEPFGFPVGVKLGYETDVGGREHLWFRSHALGEETIEATLENQPFAVPGMKLGDRGTHLAGHFVVGGAGLGAGGAEDGDGGADEVEGAEGAEEIGPDMEDGGEVVEARAWTGEKAAVGVFHLETFFFADGLLADGVLGGGAGALGAVRRGHGGWSNTIFRAAPRGKGGADGGRGKGRTAESRRSQRVAASRR